MKIVLGVVVVASALGMGLMGLWLVMVSGERNELATENGVLAFERDGLLAEKEALTDENSDLSSEVSRLKTERDALTSEKDSLAADLRREQSEKDDLSRRLSDSENDVESLTEDLGDARDSVSELNTRISALNTENMGLESFRESIQGYWAISEDKTLTVDIPFSNGSDLFPLVYFYSYRQLDPVFIVVEDTSFFSTDEISALNIVEALRWEETRTSLSFEVDLGLGRSTLTRGAYYAAILFNVETEFELVTYLDFSVE